MPKPGALGRPFFTILTGRCFPVVGAYGERAFLMPWGRCARES